MNKNALYLLHILLLCLGLALGGGTAIADTMPTLYQSFAGNMNFVGTQKTLRTGDNTNNNTASSLVTNTTTAGGSNATTATLSGLPSSGTNTIRAAYLYWAGSGTTDNTVTFENVAVTASRQYTITNAAGVTGLNYFSNVADVTAAVAAKGNGTYTLSGLRAYKTDPWYSSQAVLAGWALLVVYENPTVERFRVLNVYEGFQPFYGSNIPLTISNFRIPTSNFDGKLAHLTWEGDITNSTSSNGFNEQLTFNGSTLFDTNNPANNQFNSASTIRSGAVDSTSYGIDFDAYDVSAYLTAGETTATSVYSSGADLVLLSMEVMSVTNTPVADLGITLALSGSLVRGQTATYTVNVNNNGPNSSGTITVTNTLPTGLSFVSGSGTNWSCTAVGQAVTCAYSGSLASGASTPALTLTVGVSASASGTITNSATVAETVFDNVSGNNTATDSHSVSVADLALSMTRNGALVVGQNGSYTLNVNNGGPIESGPITVTDTLPASLSYVSRTGTNWTCGAAGQTVTCTYSGSLASGASAPALTLTVSVSGSGSITNSATATGYQYDDNLANNTATDTATIMLPLYAYYAMDEAVWTGLANEVKDSSGNNRNASSAGGTTVTTVTVPASGLKGDTCRGATIPSNTSVATQMGVNTPINPNTLGNTGTVSFWYKNNVAWTANGNNNDRTLLDATGATTAGEFWLVLQRTGDLRFMFDNASGNAQTITGAAKNFAVGSWHHIAITWNFTAHTMSIYVDGAQDATRNNNNVTSATNYGTFFVGDSKTNRYTNPNRGNSANGVIDEVRVYASALTAAQITTDMNATHGCGASAPDHILIEHASGSGVTCAPTTLTLKACANTDCTPPLYQGGVTGNMTATGNPPTVNWVGGASFSIGATGTTTKDVQVTTAGSIVFGTNSGTTTCNFGTPSCTFTSALSGFLFDVPNHKSDTVQTITVSAVKQADNSPVCIPAFHNNTSKTVNFACAYSDPTSSTKPVTVGGTNITCGNASSGASSGISLSFNNSAATTTVSYADVGQIGLTASYTGSGGSEAGLVMTGSDNFIAAPASFGVTPTGPYVAGNPFSVTVTAKNASGNTTPNFGKESTTENVLLAHTLSGPTGGNDPAFGGTTTLADASFQSGSDKGVATASDIKWNEVGDISTTATLTSGSYLGSGLTVTGSAATGPFRPAYFETEVTPGTDSFTYSGQPFTVKVTAKNASGGTTKNYAGIYAKAVTLSDANSATNNSTTLGSFTNATIAASSFIDYVSNPADAGTATISNISYAFTTKTTAPLEAPTSAPLALRATDTDTVSSSGYTEGTTPIRAGRLRLPNAYGPETEPIIMSARLEYYTGTAWALNTLDSSTNPGGIATYQLDNTLEAAQADGTILINGAATTELTITPTTAAAGLIKLRFSPPGPGKTGYTDVKALIDTSLLWLLYKWDGATDSDPKGRANFGIYRGNDRIINWREIIR